MRASVLLFTICLVAGCTGMQSIKTGYFDLKLPNTLSITVKRDGMLIAVSKETPPRRILAIEYDSRINLESRLARLNIKLKRQGVGGPMKAIHCPGGCQAYMGSVVRKDQQGTVTVFYYLIRGPRVTVVLAYGHTGPVSVGQNFVDDVAHQIMRGAI